jgi:hypothetical protein
MSKLSKRKKRLAVVAAVLIGVGVGGGLAYAYWSSTGAGSGSASTGTNTAFTVASSTATGGPLTPGGPSETVAFTVTNPGSGHQYLSSVLVTVANSDGTPWTAVPGCSSDDYAIGTPTITYGDVTPSGVVNGSVTVSMTNRAANQDGCKGATVPLYFVAS